MPFKMVKVITNQYIFDIYRSDKRLLDVVETQLTEAKRLMNLGAGTTTIVLHVRPAIKVSSTESDKSNVEVK